MTTFRDRIVVINSCDLGPQTEGDSELRFLRPKLTTSHITFSCTSMTVHWHVSVDKTCKMVLLKWSTNRLIVILFRIRSERDQLLDTVSVYNTLYVVTADIT